MDWIWSEGAENAFTILKDRLTTTPLILTFPDWTSEFVLQVDTSLVAVGGVLIQQDDKGGLKPIEFFSLGLTASQNNYSAGELECWALIAVVGNTFKRLPVSDFFRITTHSYGCAAKRILRVNFALDPGVGGIQLQCRTR